MSTRWIKITGSLICGLAIGYVLYRIGSDVQFLQKRYELAYKSSGSDSVRKLYRHKQSRTLINTIEERVSFTVPISDGATELIERKGILVRRPHARAVILICHGFMCNKDDVRFLRGTLFSDYTTFSFDFRAHGECAKQQICTFGAMEKNDVIGAVEFIRSQPDLKHKPIIVYGFSMGAVASLLAQAEKEDLFAGAIWDCPFDSTDEVIRRLISSITISIGGYQFELPGKEWLQKHAYNSYVQEFIKQTLKTVSHTDSLAISTLIKPVNTVNAAKKITIPSYFIVCKNDKKAPVSAVKSVYRATQGYKRLWITNGRAHFDSFFFNPEAYVYRVLHFIEKVISGKCANAMPQEKIIIDDPMEGNDDDYEAM